MKNYFRISVALILVTILIFVISVSCSASSNVSKRINLQEIQNKYGITRDQFNCEFEFPKDEDVISIADGICNDKLTVMYTMEAMPYDFNKLDWNVKYTISPGSFQLYLQCLYPIVYLTKAYELSGDKKYLDMSEAFILSWNKYSQDTTNANNNSMVWNDHGTALRAENIIYYALTAIKSDYLKEDTKGIITELLNEHADFLAEDSHYTKNHNHGIFQDRSLMYIAYFLNNNNKEEWLELVKKRLIEQMNFAFNNEMIHVENSPGYQIGVTNLFRIISEFLLQFNDTYGKELYDRIAKSTEFMAYITKPNGATASIGDTSDIAVGNIVAKNMDGFKNEHMTYAFSQGNKGTKPSDTSVFYAKSGYYISHNNWEKENYSNSTWTMFKSGYSSKTHKHADDNSFMLYSKGYDIFVDSGWYNYTTGDRYRDYFVSSLAHNTVIVDGKSYSPTAENSYKVGIYDYGKEKGYDYVTGYNDMYNGVMIDRHFYNLGDAIILYDNIIGDKIHTYSQLFHASESMELLEKTNTEVLFKLADTGYNVRVKQLLNNTSANVVKGGSNKESFGYISREMNKIDPINTVKFDVQGQNVDLVTLITIEDKNGNVKDINNIDFNANKKQFNIDTSNPYYISLKDRERININDVTVNQNGNSFEFTNNCISEEFSYAWYIIDKNTNEAIEKIDFASENTFKYEFGKKGDYFIRAYIKNNKNQKKFGIVAAISYNEESKEWKNVSSQYPYLNLVYNGQSYQKMEHNKYKFIVDYNYSLNSSIKWYIYRNGMYYSVAETKNSNEFEYTFDEPGNYAILYYLTTQEKNNEFWNFPMIEIK